MSSKSLHQKARRLVRWLPVVLLLGACATGTIREKLLNLPTIDGATYVGQETCAGCHEDKAASLAHNIHGRLADFELMGGQKGCESCHGPGSLHVAGEGDTSKILQPATLDADETGALCARCHTSGKLMDWTHSEHALADLSCTDCHTMHGNETPLKANLKQEDPELCYGCHQEQLAKANFPSHHPVKEGRMTCSSCHNAHGELLTDERKNDLCLSCHTRYQGPFVFGHAPVEDDCTICHDPHGSVANNLLVQNEPFLCLQCHEGHFHILRAGSTDPAVAGANPHGAEGFQKSFSTKCTSCHQVVHGSDLPSQPLSGGGLTR